MLQEIIVYLILIFTGLYLIRKSFGFFKPEKASNASSGCAGGSCSSCAFKIDFDSMHPDHSNQNSPNYKTIKMNDCH